MYPNPNDLCDKVFTVRLNRPSQLFVQAMSASTGIPPAVIIRNAVERCLVDGVSHALNGRPAGPALPASVQPLSSSC